MEDDKIISLFKDFNPRMTSDAAFMRQLEDRLRSVEIVKKEIEAGRRRCRRAVVASATVGLVAGILLGLALPTLSGLLSNLHVTGRALELIVNNASTVVLTCIAATSGILALNTYELSLYLQRKHIRT